MNYKYLGNSDLKVSTYCLGTMTFGETTSEEDGHYQLDESVTSGINFIDTAEMYPTCPLRPETTGDTEIIVGNWITKNKSKRSSIVLATKVSGKGYMAVRNGEGINAKSVKIAIEGTLKKLQTDYIDLYQLHWPERKAPRFGDLDFKYEPNDKWTPIEDVLENLDRLVQAGKIRYVGLSNETPWGIMKFLQTALEKNLPRIVSIQNV